MSTSFEKREQWYFDCEELKIVHTITYQIIERIKEHNITKSATVLCSSSDEKIYGLREVSIDELKNIRKSNLPIFVYKKASLLFYCFVPREIRITQTNLGHHICANLNQTVCTRLSALPDPDGCKCIRDSKRKIEEYPWIVEGYQYTNCIENGFHICKCSNYSKYLKEEKNFLSKKMAFKNLEELYYN